MSSTRSVPEIRQLGSCRVNLGGRDMGHTQGGVAVKITVDQQEVLVDEYGVVPVAITDRGTTIEATVPLIQASWDNYVSAFPTGAAGIIAGNQLSFGRKVGTAITLARLVLDPLRAADTDGIVIYRAYVKDVAELGFNNDGERVIAITFGGAIDAGRAEGDKVFRIFGGMS